MPRPGCVWSHALLLDPRAIASLSTFSELLLLFRRPTAQDTPRYAQPLELTSKRSSEPADVRLISTVIERFYAGRQVIVSFQEHDPADIERAILAVWSQQWPRLRASFSFCTASVIERRRSESDGYDVQVTQGGEPHSSGWQSWVSLAAADAAENTVTPLRRFLWRYGRDLVNPRRHYKMLVELFEQSTSSDEMSTEAATIVFESLPDPSEGAVLKRDITGIGSHSPRLIAAIPAVHLLELLTSEALPEMPTSPQVGQRLEELTASQIGKVAQYYDVHMEALKPYRDSITKAIISLADKATIVAADFPPRMLADVLLARSDLIDAETLQPLTTDVLDRLLGEDTPQQVAEHVILEMLRRDLGGTEDRILAARPIIAFRCAIQALLSQRLDQSWLRSIPRHRDAILDAPWLEVLQSTAEVAAGFAILRYPRNLMKTTDELSRRISELRDDAQQPERSNMQAVLLRAAIDELSPKSWRLLSLVLPELRTTILHGSLPSAAHTLLTDDLPHFYSAAYWDLNKQILLSLSKLYSSSPNESALHELGLSPSEARLIEFGEEREKRKSWTRLWD